MLESARIVVVVSILVNPDFLHIPLTFLDYHGIRDIQSELYVIFVKDVDISRFRHSTFFLVAIAFLKAATALGVQARQRADA